MVLVVFVVENKFKLTINRTLVLWLTFQPGEIRVCGSCHGVNSIDQKGGDAPTNQPEALRLLLEHWKGIPHQNPLMSLELEPRPKPRKSNVLRGAGKLAVIVKGSNAQSAQRAVTLSLSVAKQDCSTVAEFTTDTQGNYLLNSRKLPLLSKKAQLTFAIFSSATLLDKKSIELSAAPKGKIKARGICSALKKAFR